MKCEVCQELLEEYLDGELATEDRDDVGAHLITCAGCAEALATLSAEEELYGRYDRELRISAAVWVGISEQIDPVAESSFGWWARIAAGLVLTIGLGSVFLLTRGSETITALELPELKPVLITSQTIIKRKGIKTIKKKPMVTDNRVPDNPGVLSADLGYLDIDEQETAKHIEQTENLLRSIRNFTVSDSDDEVDVSYDKALSRRLLIENVVLRRDAEMKAKFPTKTLLADLEPFLIDIANLPDCARAEEVRAIKERVQKTEIVAALLDYPR